jgi:HAD superfamily hydrolase (TIGR01549 family)
MPIKVVAFDLWSTLVSGTPIDIMDEVSAKMGFDSTTDFWSYCDENYFNTNMKIKDLLVKIKEERDLDVDVDKLSSMWENGLDRVKVYPDVIPTLKTLRKKYKLALISNTGSEEGKMMLQIFGLRGYFDYIIMSYEVGLAKPHPAMFELVTKKFSVKPDEVAYIGDGMKNDFLAGKSVGFRTFLIDRKDKHPEYRGKDWYITTLEGIEGKLN